VTVISLSLVVNGSCVSRLSPYVSCWYKGGRSLLEGSQRLGRIVIVFNLANIVALKFLWMRARSDTIWREMDVFQLPKVRGKGTGTWHGQGVGTGGGAGGLSLNAQLILQCNFVYFQTSTFQVPMHILLVMCARSLSASGVEFGV
jgi:hypothetical protein